MLIFLIFDKVLKKDIAIGSNARNAKPDNAKNFTLTPANQATVRPPAAIKIEVPRSGCVATKSTGATKPLLVKINILNYLNFLLRYDDSI